MRALYLGGHPVCEDCNRAEATQVHHQVGIHSGGPVFANDNLAALCTKCHARREAQVKASA